MLKPTVFREYDIRGIADVDFEDAGVEDLGRALGTYLQRHGGKRVNLGRDCRLSSERLRAALSRGLVAAGCDVTDIGVVPTPVLYYSAVRLGADGAVMITGSHNPAQYNGFKTVCGGGAIYGHQIQEVREILEEQDFVQGRGTQREVDVVTPYVEEISSQFQFKRRVKVVFDAGNGTAGPVMRRLLARLNCDAVELFFEMNGTFPNHHPDPTIMANLSPLIAAVAENRADFGVAFDGDADRVGVVDENGTVIFGDLLLLIYGREILSRKPGATIIGEVKCSQVLFDELARLGANAIMYRTGHSLIKAKMKKEHADLAGEMSGHMFFADRYYGFDDALYAACRLMEIVAKSGQPLSAQLAGLPKMVSTPEIRVECPDETKFEIVKKIAERFRKTHEIVEIDGVRVKFPEGWGLVRASNTEPVLVLRFEAKSGAALADYQEELQRALDEARGSLVP
jgi:phosphomannomutase/phosphoglucomutase